MPRTLPNQQKTCLNLQEWQSPAGNNSVGLHNLLSRLIRKLALAILASPLIFLASTAVMASEYECRSGQQTRHIRIDYPGYDHLCEVSVTKLGQSREVKWYADQDSTFCSEKIIELVNKHQNQWGFSCEQWPNNDGLDELNTRQRKFLDTLVQKNRLIDNNDVEFVLLGTRALIEPSKTNNKKAAADLLAIQLFMANLASAAPDANTGSDTLATPSINQNDLHDNTTTLANRVILFADDGESYDTLATLDNLNNFIEIAEQGYHLDSAMIDTLHPNGDLDVSTLIAAPDDDPRSLPSCYGTQRFRKTATGLLAINQHQFTCE